MTRFGLASDLTEHKRQSTCGGSRQVSEIVGEKIRIVVLQLAISYCLEYAILSVRPSVRPLLVCL